MSIIIFGKIFAGVAVALGGSLAIYFGREWLFDSEVYVYGVTEVISSGASGPMKHGDSNEFKCVFSKQEFDCDVEAITFDKNQFIADKTATKALGDNGKKTPNANIAATDIQDADKVYKIATMKSKILGWDNDPAKRLDIFKFANGSQLSKETDNQYAKIKVLFVEQKEQFLGKTNHFVGTASGVLATSTSYKCSWEKSGTYEDCYINDFAASDNAKAELSTLTFIKPSNKESSGTLTTAKDTRYLISFKTTQDIWTNKDKKIIFAKDVNDVAPIEFADIHASELAGENILILK